MKKALCIVLCAVLVSGVCASTVLGVFAVINSQKAVEVLNRQFPDQAQTREDDVVIMGEYRIVSTVAISDAYKSGNTSGLTERQKETLDMGDAVLKEIIRDGMTDYEKERAVYDWMVANLNQDQGVLTVIPSSGEGSDNPYGVLKYRNAVCVGFATTFRMLMQMLGLDCMVVHDTSLTHSWDLVKLEDAWYHVDIYHDSGTGADRDFNMDDNMAMQNHTWDTSYFPEATSLKYNPVANAAVAVDSVYDIPAVVRERLLQGERLFGMKFGAELTEQEASIGNNIIERIAAVLNAGYQYSDIFMSYFWSSLSDGWLMLVTVDGYPADGSEISEEENNSMNQAIRDSFGDLGETYVLDDYTVSEGGAMGE